MSGFGGGEVQFAGTAAHLDDAEWETRITTFLESRPNSSLLLVVQHLWPDFFGYHTDHRADLWFWAKEKLQSLEMRNLVISRDDEDGVALWSAAPSDAYKPTSTWRSDAR